MASRAGVYTHGHHESVLRSHRWRTAENSAAYLLPLLRPGMSLLDVGCGPGTVTADLAVRLAPGHVLGIDPAADAVTAARAAVAERGAAARIEVGDVFELAGDDDGERFDVVHAHQVLQHVADPVGALRAMARLAAPGGIVAARDSDYAGMTWYPRLPGLDRWMALYQAAARANGGEPDAGRHLLAWAHAAGLADVRVSASSWCFATDDDRAWWGGMWADRIVESALARQLVDTGLAATDELRDLAGTWRQWAEHPDAVFTIGHGEILATTPTPDRANATR
jgi:2-polyprenyl-3-methyl-5-hydroxy-6-metoxy-1,4-benzoquinol methylase